MNEIQLILQTDNSTRIFCLGKHSIFFSGLNRGIDIQNRNDKLLNVNTAKEI